MPVQYEYFGSEKCKECGHEENDHSAHHCDYRRHGALLSCDCRGFVSPTMEAIATLPYDEQEVLACACRLSLDPKEISRIETTTDDNGHPTGFDVVIHVPIDRPVNEWVKAHTPKRNYRHVTKYLVEITSE